LAREQFTMKIFRLNNFKILLLVLGFVQVSSACELSKCTNSSLLEEVERRLQEGGGVDSEAIIYSRNYGCNDASKAIYTIKVSQNVVRDKAYCSNLSGGIASEYGKLYKLYRGQCTSLGEIRNYYKYKDMCLKTVIDIHNGN
jgi:hypothetical protein